jgi:hypothetical protein
MASIERFACWTAAIVVRRQSDAMPGRAILRDPQDAVERPPGFLEKLYNPKRLRSFLGYLPREARGLTWLPRRAGQTGGLSGPL